MYSSMNRTMIVVNIVQNGTTVHRMMIVFDDNPGAVMVGRVSLSTYFCGVFEVKNEQSSSERQVPH